MACRLNTIPLVALPVILFCSTSFANTPLVVAELDAKREIAEADAARANAEHDLAVWTLTQLQELRSRGHASWQEVARQEVTAKSRAADVQASERYLEAVLQWHARLMKPDVRHSPTESECVRLYLPGSARLVASISAEVASPELSKRHLENLRAEHQSLSEIKLSSLEAAITTAKTAVEVYGRSAKDADLLSRAKIQLRFANAAYDCAKTRRESAIVIARRMVLIQTSLDEQQSNHEEPSPALARVGTRFVDATSDRELARLVGAMSIDESTASERIAWLKHQYEAALDRIDALQELAEYSHADPNELEQSKQLKSDLELKIGRAQELLAVKQQIAGDFQRKSELLPTNNVRQAESLALDNAWFAGANEARHCLQLQQLKLETAASLTAIKAERDYLVERLKRVERIDEQARPPKELEHSRHKVQGVEQQLAMVDRDLALLNSEQQRFYHQVKSQQGQQYRLVQADQGKFFSREQFEVAAGLIAVVGFVGEGELFHEMPSLYPYIESTTVFDCMSQLSIQAAGATEEFDSLLSWRPGNDLLRQGAQSSWNTRTSSGLRLATDGFSYAKDLFCYRPYEFWQVRGDQRWAAYDYFRPAATRGFRSFDPYDRYPFGSCGRSIFAYRVGSPTRASFPYRNSYLYRTAFPTRSILYSYPYARPSVLAGSCFD